MEAYIAILSGFIIGAAIKGTVDRISTFVAAIVFPVILGMSAYQCGKDQYAAAKRREAAMKQAGTVDEEGV